MLFKINDENAVNTEEITSVHVHEVVTWELHISFIDGRRRMVCKFDDKDLATEAVNGITSTFK